LQFSFSPHLRYDTEKEEDGKKKRKKQERGEKTREIEESTGRGDEDIR
jgi:hypothetical protein